MAKDKLLFTPGPLTTSKTVKEAALHDLGSRDGKFIRIVKEIREKLLDISSASRDDYEAILLQGTGTYGLEAVVTSTVPPDGKLLIIINGAYGKRIAKIADIHRIDNEKLSFAENQKPQINKIEEVLKNDPRITNVVVVHCETTTGILNPIKEIGNTVKKYNKIFFVDAMSSFGAIPIDFAACKIDYLVSSANKCVEGIPGFTFVIAKKSEINKTEGYSRTLSFDLYDQLRGFEKNGQFRFTPPTHALLAFHQALLELEEEGGVEGRAKRYRENYETLISGMREMGFTEYLPTEDQTYIITSFLYPKDKNFSFEKFYNKLSERDMLIYPGKLSDEDCFRIGNIGRLYKEDVKDLLVAIKDVLNEMNVSLK